MSPITNYPKVVSAALEERLRASSPEERITAFLDLTSAPVLATSFGAQSAASLYIVTRLCPEIPVVFVKEPKIDPGTEAYMTTLAERFKLQLHTVHVRTSDEKLTAFNRVLQAMGSTGWISGIRQAQSWTRASAKVIETQDGRLKLHPIFDWTNEQIAEYYTRHNLPIHPTLGDNFNGAGIPRGSAVLADTSDLASHTFPRECGLHRRFTDIEREQG